MSTVAVKRDPAVPPGACDPPQTSSRYRSSLQPFTSSENSSDPAPLGLLCAIITRSASAFVQSRCDSESEHLWQSDTTFRTKDTHSWRSAAPTEREWTECHEDEWRSYWFGCAGAPAPPRDPAASTPRGREGLLLLAPGWKTATPSPTCASGSLPTPARPASGGCTHSNAPIRSNDANAQTHRRRPSELAGNGGVIAAPPSPAQSAWTRRLAPVRDILAVR